MNTPWKMEAGFIADSLGNVVCLGFEPGAKERFENWETNIRRIAAAVNACEGIETEWLETGVNLKSQISDAIKERNKAYNAVMAEIAEKEYLQAQNARLLELLKMVSETGGSLKNRELSEVRAAIIEAEKQPSNP